ncbi:hypothetical protein DFP73DRAFT_53117 [Morchella snyderi]|nr:hypothetical protein DFP73DRAFT_53117 [Morchella snyderi]
MTVFVRCLCAWLLLPGTLEEYVPTHIPYRGWYAQTGFPTVEYSDSQAFGEYTPFDEQGLRPIRIRISKSNSQFDWLLHTNSPNGCIRQMPVNRCTPPRPPSAPGTSIDM